jgi:two-component system, OmpR family, response regulator VanR
MDKKATEGEKRILIVEDDHAIADLIEIHLVNDGYEVFKAEDGASAMAFLDKNTVHLVILDIMMPGMDGLEVCRRIRKTLNTPILMLSAKSQDMDKVLGLSTGADDYLTKPFNVVELLARVKSQLRRYLTLNPQSAPSEEADAIAAGGVVIDKSSHVITVNDREIQLTPTEFDILLLLASHPDRVFSAEEIFRRVWEDRYYDSNNTVMVHIRKIREKIEEDPGNPVIIKTVWGVGYKIEK